MALGVVVWAVAVPASWPDGPYLSDLLTHLAPTLIAAMLLVALAAGIRRRWGAAGAVLLAALVTGASVWVRWSAVTAPGGVEGPGLRVVSYNCASESVASDARFVRWLAAQEADLVALLEAPRELDASWAPVLEQFPHRVGPVRGKMWSVWLLSRHPLEIIELEEPTERSRFVYAVRRSALVTLPTGGRVVFTAGHPPSPRTIRTWRRALSWAETAGGAIRRYSERTGTPVILATDVNAAPWGRVARALASFGGLTAPTPLLGAGTYPAWCPPWLGVPIDTVWTRGGGGEHLEVGPRCGSDHRPVLVEVRLGR